MWMLAALASAVFAALTSIFGKFGMQDIDSHRATAIRTCVVIVIAWLIVICTGALPEIMVIQPITWVFLILSGFSTGASWLCYFSALQLGEVNRVVPVDRLSVVITMLLGFGLLGEPFGPFQLIALVLIGLGTWLMAVPRGNLARLGRRDSWFFFALGSAVFASLTSIFGKIGIADVDSNLGTAIRTVIVLIMAWGMVFLTRKERKKTAIAKRDWWFLVLSGLTTGLSWLCFFYALQVGPASGVVPIDKLSIVFAILFARIALRETLTRRSGAGLVMIIAGTLLVLIEV